MRKLFILFALTLSCILSYAQQEPQFISGPMIGYAEHRSVLIWCEVSQEVRSVTIRYWERDNKEFYYETDYKGQLGNPYNPIKFELLKLKMNAQYQYEIILNGKLIPFSDPHYFKTKDLWEHRKPAPDFSFITGSCAYINDEKYDRPGEPYGQDPVIFRTMANTASDFMLWLGDNLYYREADYSSFAGMQYRYSYQRRAHELQPLFASRPNYAIWDDHDYGPNDANKTFELRENSIKLFKDYWGNKSYGENNNDGVYGKFTWSDCEFFLTDDRSHRSPNELKDSIAGKPNCEKEFFGMSQLAWLENSLLSSDATFKFIAVGNEVLNPLSDYECLRHFSCEFTELMSFISAYKISGIVFLTGDRHFSEVITWQPKGGYKMYDITSSALTSEAANITGRPEFNNPNRVPGTLVMENNFSKISISGAEGDRKLKMLCLDKKGEVKSQIEISAKDLQYK
jgi:alkaline phosphatase D